MAHIVCVSARMASAAQPGYFHWLAIVFVVSDDERHIVVSAHFAGLWRDDPEDLSRQYTNNTIPINKVKVTLIADPSGQSLAAKN